MGRNRITVLFITLQKSRVGKKKPQKQQTKTTNQQPQTKMHTITNANSHQIVQFIDGNSKLIQNMPSLHVVFYP